MVQIAKPNTCYIQRSLLSSGEKFFKEIKQNFSESNSQIINSVSDYHFSNQISFLEIPMQDFYTRLNEFNDNSTDKNYFQISGLKLVVGKIIVSYKEPVRIKYSNFLSLLNFISQFLQVFPHLKEGVSFAIVENDCNMQIPLIFSNKTQSADYDIQQQIPQYTGIERKTYESIYNFYNLYKKTDGDLEAIKHKVYRKFNLSIYSIEEWESSQKEITQIISPILREKFPIEIKNSFMYGFNLLSDSEKNKFIRDMVHAPINSQFTTFMKNIFRIDEVEIKKYQDDNCEELRLEGIRIAQNNNDLIVIQKFWILIGLITIFIILIVINYLVFPIFYMHK